MNVYVLTRVCDGDVVVDGVFKSNSNAKKKIKELKKEFGLEKIDDDDLEFTWEIHQEILE